MTAHSGTRSKALVEAQSLLQRYGFNGFSFNHIADALKIKAPSLYSHFRSKEELGAELIAEYEKSFGAWIETIEFVNPADKVTGLFEKFFKFCSEEGKYCPLVALSGDLHTLSPALRKSVRRAYELQREWLVATIRDGQKGGLFRRDLSADRLADVVLSLGYGAQQAGRLSGDPGMIRELRESTLKLLKP